MGLSTVKVLQRVNMDRVEFARGLVYVLNGGMSLSMPAQPVLPVPPEQLVLVLAGVTVHEP